MKKTKCYFTLKIILKYFVIFSVTICPIAFLAAKEKSCTQFLYKASSSNLKYFQGRDIRVSLIPVDWSKTESPGFSEGFKSLERKPKMIANALDLLGINEDSILQTLVYPASGYDATTGFLVAPRVTTVVGIDNHPFMKTSTTVLMPEPYFSANDIGYGWTVISEVDQKNYVAEIILARLQSAISGFRLLKVLNVQDLTKDNLDSIALSHGVILFDSGEGTPVKSYVHLQSPVLNDYEMGPTSWWLEAVLQNGFKVLVRKAAMSFYNYPVGLDLIQHLKTNQGLMIDGDNEAGSFPKYNLERILSEVPSLELNVSNFGYDKRTKIYFFQRLKP